MAWKQLLQMSTLNLHVNKRQSTGRYDSFIKLLSGNKKSEARKSLDRMHCWHQIMRNADPYFSSISWSQKYQGDIYFNDEKLAENCRFWILHYFPDHKLIEFMVLTDSRSAECEVSANLQNIFVQFSNSAETITPHGLHSLVVTILLEKRLSRWMTFTAQTQKIHYKVHYARWFFGRW